ncbi:MAG: ferredoxin [Dehalococcoidia bacterium]
MKVNVDHDLCEGHAKCSKTAPDVFEVGDDDQSRVKLADVPEKYRDQVELAVRLCPRQAIWIEE